MTPLGEYIAGRGEAPPRRELNRLVDACEWFTAARRARALVTGDPDPALVLPLGFWPTVPPERAVLSAPPESPPDAIERFIEHGGYRIVPTDGVQDAGVDVDIDPGMVTEELAEIYRAQGLTEEADKIYRILNLYNS